MAEQESWIERRQRRVRCKAHGLHYEPRLTSGCVLCVKAWAKLVPRSAPQFTIVLLCILGMTVILYRIFAPGQIAGAMPITAEEAPADVRLAPGPYRQPIANLEAVLFAPVEDGRDLDNAASSFAAAAADLSDRIRRLDPRRADIADLVSELGAAAAESFGFAGLERLRADWLRLRGRELQPAEWFLTPAMPGSARDRAALAEHRELARRLRLLLYEGAAQAQAIVEGAGGAGSGEPWRRFAAGWRERLDELWRGRPPRPAAGAAVELLVGTQELERAFERTRALASDARLVAAENPAARFDDVMALVDKAESSFEAVTL